MFENSTYIIYKTTMPKQEIEGYCHNCHADKWSWVKTEHKDRNDYEEHGMWWVSIHRILECKSCSFVFYQLEETSSEDIKLWYNSKGETEGEYVKSFTYYPQREKHQEPAWFYEIDEKDSELANIFEEIYSAFNNDLKILTAIGIRTAFDRITELLGINPRKPFNEKLNALKNKGLITTKEREDLDVLIDAGNAAAHRGWVPSNDLLKALLSYLESFTHRVMLSTGSLTHFQDSIPKKPSKASQNPTSKTS